MHWSPITPVVGGGRKTSLVNDAGETVATVVELPGTMARSYVYTGVRQTLDEPTFDWAKARTTDVLGFTSGAYREARAAHDGSLVV